MGFAPELEHWRLLSTCLLAPVVLGAGLLKSLSTSAWQTFGVPFCLSLALGGVLASVENCI